MYIKGGVKEIGYYETFIKTDNDQRLKTPLWLIILLIIVFFIPIINVLAIICVFLCRLEIGVAGNLRRYYCESIFTKKF